MRKQSSTLALASLALLAGQAGAQTSAQIVVTGTVSALSSSSFTASQYNNAAIGNACTFAYSVDLDAVNETYNGSGTLVLAEYELAQGPITLNIGTVSASASPSGSVFQVDPDFQMGTNGNLPSGLPRDNFDGTVTFPGNVMAHYELADSINDIVQTFDLFDNGSFSYSGFTNETLIVYGPAVGGGLAWIEMSSIGLAVTVPIAHNYCSSPANSTGAQGVMTASGSAVAASNNLVLNASSLPANVFGQAVVSLTKGSQTVGQGTLCLGGSIGRYNGPGDIFVTDAQGMASYSPDLTQTPQGSGFVSIMAGETWNFQIYHRDVTSGGQQTSNFTNALEVYFR